MIDASVFQSIQTLHNSLKVKVIGQENLTKMLLITLLANQHILVEGPPGVAKTRAVSVFSALLGLTFQRIQFTSDLLPSDIIGSEIYRPQTQSFEVLKGPIFHELILADEINRAPAKVQSALLEAMGER